MASFNGTLCDADADGFDGHFDLSISAQDVAQRDDVIGSAFPFYTGRGNRLFTVSFKARKRHATVSAAASYCGDHAEATSGTYAFSGFGLSLTKATCAVTVSHIGLVTIAS